MAETKTKTQTLTEYAKACGSQKVAAANIGVTEGTLNRWLHGHIHPRGLSIVRLKELGVEV